MIDRIADIVLLQGTQMLHYSYQRVKRPPTTPETRGSSRSLMDIERVKLLESEADVARIVLGRAREAMMAADPCLSPDDDIRSSAAFETFWRTLVCNRGYWNHEELPASTVVDFCFWYLFLKLMAGRGWRRDRAKFELHRSVLAFLSAKFNTLVRSFWGFRNLFISANGRAGWAPYRAQPGDEVFIFQGSALPFAAKRVGSGDGWEYMGACYVHGLMQGEAWELEGLEWTIMRFV